MKHVLPPEANQTLSILKECLGQTLLAVYLHGSAVCGGLRAHSDVDVLAIISQPMAPPTRQRLLNEMLRLSATSSRPLELVVFVLGQFNQAEFVYGEWPGYEPAQVPVGDPEFTLLLAQAQQWVLPLMGEKELLPHISQPAVRQAIKEALPALLAGVEGDERNVLLTLARMWRSLSQGDFVAKDVAAQWAAARLPREQATVLELARTAYLGEYDGQLPDVRRTVNFLHQLVVSLL